MKLFYRKMGEGKPLIILHGLFGQSDNWNSFGKQMEQEGYAVFLVDLRNHGYSPHSNEWNYKVMSADILELINNDELLKNEKIILLGHSMGGKVAMQFATEHPEFLEKLIIVDIAPKPYPPHHQDIIKGLNAVNLSQIKSRKEAEEILSEYINDIGTKQFLLKNLYRNLNTEEKANAEIFNWRFNLKTISEKIDQIGEDLPKKSSCSIPTLFIKGAESSYIEQKDFISMLEKFPNSRVETIKDAGHWVHAEKPKEFFETIIKFIK